jgi:hypothetical protein
LLTTQLEITSELSARGAPNVLDLAVALLSGMAAAYALSRPSLMGAIVGVAIATALVPPLATVGISLAHSEWELSIGSATLFITNVVAIILGTAVVFRVLGTQGSTTAFGRSLVFRRVLLFLSLGFALLTIPLYVNLSQRLAEGEDRALVLPASESIRNELHSRIEREPGVTLYMIARPGLDPDYMVRVELLAAVPISQALRRDITEIIRGHMGPEVVIQIAVVNAQLLEYQPGQVPEDSMSQPSDAEPGDQGDKATASRASLRSYYPNASGDAHDRRRCSPYTSHIERRNTTEKAGVDYEDPEITCRHLLPVGLGSGGLVRHHHDEERQGV